MAATVIVEVLITLVVQYLFCGLGLVLILHTAPGTGAALELLGGVVAVSAYPDSDIFLRRMGPMGNIGPNHSSSA